MPVENKEDNLHALDILRTSFQLSETGEGLICKIGKLFRRDVSRKVHPEKNQLKFKTFEILELPKKRLLVVSISKFGNDLD